MGSSPFARRYWGNRCYFLFLQVLRCFSSLRWLPPQGGGGIASAGLPHSDICGSMRICRSPQLFAACHVLLRLREPRHPPCALSRLRYLFSGLTQLPESCFIWFRLCLDGLRHLTVPLLSPARGDAPRHSARFVALSFLLVALCLSLQSAPVRSPRAGRSFRSFLSLPAMSLYSFYWWRITDSNR